MKPIRFRLYPERRSLYFVVHVWPTRKAMLKRLKAIHHEFTEDVAANCSLSEYYRCWPGRPLRLKPQCGEINFHRERLSIEIASHEITHAAVGWARRMGIDPMAVDGESPYESSDNERFAYAQGRMVAQFNSQAYRRKAWPGL